MLSGERLRDWTLLLLCNFIWASQFVLVKIVQEQMGPIAATSLPMLLATLLLIPIVAWKSRSVTAVLPKHLAGDRIRFLVLGVLGQVAAQLFITWGLRYTLASNAALLMLALPIVTAVMAYILLGEKMSGSRWFSFALAIVGVAECSGINWKELDLGSSTYFTGNLLLLISVCGSAFYNVFSKKLLERYSPLQVLLYSYYFVCLFLVPITLYMEPGTLRAIDSYTLRTWAGIALLAIFQYCLSMVIFLTVLTRLDAIQASLSNYLIPFFGLIIAGLVLHERLTTPMIAGGALVLFSTLIITAYEARCKLEPPTIKS